MEKLRSAPFEKGRSCFMGAASGAIFWLMAVFGGHEVRRRPPGFLVLR
jgi:hypothetical protein